VVLYPNTISSFDFHKDGISPEEKSTFIIASLSASFHKDFREVFRSLNFPINDELYEEIYDVVCNRC
jgi:hypothetical protein